MPKPRVLKLADQIKSIVAQLLEKRIKDPRLGFVTITDVRLTGDTREATVFYSVYGDDAALAGSAAALASATGMIRSTVGKQLGLRHAPSITFVLDALPETAAGIEDLLARAQAGDAALADQRAGAAYAGEADPYRRTEDEDAEEVVDSVDAADVDDAADVGDAADVDDVDDVGDAADDDDAAEVDDESPVVEVDDPAHEDDQADPSGPADPADLFERD